MSATPERLSRRRLLLGAAGLGLGAATGAVTLLATRQDSKPIATPEIVLPKFDFDITSQITESDWKHIMADIKNEKDVGDKIGWKAMLETIDKERAQKISLDDDDMDAAISELDHLTERWDLHWDIYLNKAARIKIAFPEKTDKLHSVIDVWNTDIDRNFQNITDNIGSPYYISGVTYLDIPKLGFQFKNILYPQQDAQVDETKWTGFNRTLDWAYQQNYMTLITDSCSRLKHFAAERLPQYYFDEEFPQAQRQHATDRLEKFRTVENWHGMIDWAETVQLNEANSVQMTPQGLVLS